MEKMHRQRSPYAYTNEILRILKAGKLKRHTAFRRLRSLVSMLFTRQPGNSEAICTFGEFCQAIRQQSALEGAIREILLRAREARWRAQPADAHDAANYHNFEMMDEDGEMEHPEIREEVPLDTDNSVIDIFEQIGPATPAADSDPFYRGIGKRCSIGADRDVTSLDTHSRPLHWTYIPLSVLEGDSSFESQTDGLSTEHVMVAENRHLEDIAGHLPNLRGAAPQFFGWGSGEPIQEELWVCSDTEWLLMSDMGFTGGLDDNDSDDRVQWGVAV